MWRPAAFGSRLLRRRASLHEAEDVFEHDDRVINEPGKCESKAAQKHRVDASAQGAHNQEADEYREWDGEQSRYGGAPAAKKQQNHQAGQHAADARFLDQISDRAFDKDRLVKDHRGLERSWDVDQIFDCGTHAVDDGDGVALAGLLEHGHVHRLLPVDANDVGLNGAAILGVSDIADEDGGVAD